MGSREFIDWVKEKFSELLFKEEIPEAKKLAPDVDMIKRAVREVYGIDSARLEGLHRGS
ncbi:MAG: hypothetical protein HZA78_08255 [Candidatus Schekmanbacteria bacterium]|nr:hypothetical protein [Candidatus Schekmanbacteria bacterium]